MSLNGSLNAVIALIENRPEIAKEIFRARGSDVKDISGATARLYSALDKYVACKLREILVTTLAIEPSYNEVNEEEGEFYAGVRAVEEVLESWLSALESE